MSTKADMAIAFHDKGYNCAQAVACSFCQEFGVAEEEMFRIAEGFGLGMGMMEVCGALSGMMMIIGLENSVGEPAISSSCDPCSTILPAFMTRISSAFRIVERRCATIKLVRPSIRRSKAS